MLRQVVKFGLGLWPCWAELQLGPIFVLLVSLLCTGHAFSDNATYQTTALQEFDTIDIKLLPGGGRLPVSLSVKLAKTEEQRRHGLMFTSNLPYRHGMLFVFETEVVRQFWMKNTQISLDILFFDAAGHLVSLVVAAQPFSLTLRESKSPARYVLEINGGSAAEIGVQADAKLLLPLVRE